MNRPDQPHPDSPAAFLEHVRDYLTHLAVEGHVAASTQNDALIGLLFLSCSSSPEREAWRKS